ncbi:MAG: rhodanese-like domain-containing protein [Frankiaceae bacterium]
MVAWWLRFGAVPEMSPRRLYDRLTRGDRVQIVDVRTHQEFSNGHIAGAVSVPIQSLRRKLPELALDPSRPVVTICKTAHRSIPATRLLRAQGFDAAQLAKGMDEWRRQQLPVERS